MALFPHFEPQIPLFRSWDVADFVGKASSVLLLILTLKNLVLGEFLLAGLVFVVFSMFVVDIWSYRRGAGLPIPVNALLLALLGLICVSVLSDGPNGALWTFPAVLGAFIAIPLSQATRFSVVAGLVVTAVLEISGATLLGLWFAMALGFSVLLMRFSVEQAVTLQRELLESSYRDSMTGCHNRRVLENMLSMPELSQRLYGLVLIDVDHFKGINDKFGHTVGDLVLIQVAHKIRAEAPEGAYVLRTGGDEFLVLVPEATDDTLQEVAQGLLTRVSETVRCGEDPITLSIGTNPSRPLSELDESLVAADRRLLFAKKQGRNRVGEGQLDLADARK